MQKLLISFILFFLIQLQGFSTMIEGGVKFDVNSAREYVQQEQVDSIQILGRAVFDKNDSNIKRVVYSYNNSGEIIGETVEYRDALNMGYIYVNGRLKYVDKYDRDTSLYPHRGYRYNLSGELILTSLSVSKNEHYRFSPDGNLIAHSINGIIYDENGNVIGRAK